MDQRDLNIFMIQRFVLQRTLSSLDSLLPTIILNQTFPLFSLCPPPQPLGLNNFHLNIFQVEQDSRSRRGSHGDKHSQAGSGILTPKPLYYKLKSKRYLVFLFWNVWPSLTNHPDLSFRTGSGRVMLLSHWRKTEKTEDILVLCPSGTFKVIRLVGSPFGETTILCSSGRNISHRSVILSSLSHHFLSFCVPSIAGRRKSSFYPGSWKEPP